MRRRVWIAGLALPLATATAAQGQVVVGPASGEPLLGVADRPRPEYSPIGGRLGSFFLYPRVDASVQYTDNLRGTPTDKISDEILDVRPSVDLVSGWSRNLLDLRAYYDHDFHAHTSSENYSQFGAAALTRLDFARATHLQINASADRLIESRTDINSPNGTIDSNYATTSPIRYTNLALSANLSQAFNRLTVIGNAGVNRQKFDDATLLNGQPLDQQFRNNTLFDAYLEGRYALGGSTSIIAHIERSEISYDENELVGFDRNSVSYTAQLGVGLQISQLVKGDIRVGYFTQNNRDPRFLDSSGVGFSANLVYNITPTTTIRVYADRSVQPSGSIVTSGNVVSTGALTVEHEFLRNLTGSAYARYSSIDPQATVNLGTGQEYEGRLGATYYLSRRFRFNASLDHYSRRGVFGNLDVNAASLGVAVTL